MILMLAVGAFLFVSRASAHDVNGDHTVNMDDVNVVIDAFGSFNETIGGGQAHPRWNETADITGPLVFPDGRVDMMDVVLVLTEFGQTV